MFEHLRHRPLPAPGPRHGAARCGGPARRKLPALLPTLSAVTLALASAALLVLAGCASSAGIAPRARLLEPSTLGLAAEPGPASRTPPVPADWWRGYGSPELDRLIAQALEGNPNLLAAQARLEQAGAVLAGVQAAESPQLGLAADATRQRFSATSIYPPPLGGSVRTLATAQLGASWEIDFFGRHRAAIEAAAGQRRAAEADLAAARNLLAAQVARTWVQLGRLAEQRAIAMRALQQRDDTLALIRQRVDAGLDSHVEQRLGEGALPETRLQIEQLDEQMVLTRHALAALSAQAPTALDALAPGAAALAAVPAVALPTAVPVDLLGRRADIAAARWRVEAALREVQGARAQFYPNINLAAFAGLASIGLDRLLRADSEQYGAGPALHLPIFDAGLLRARLSARTSESDAAVESYNASVLEALHEVADALGSLRSLVLQQAEQARAQDAAESAYGLARQRYQAGLGNYLLVLNAESAVLAQRRLATDLKARALETQIALIRALGGGYLAPAATAGTATVGATLPP